MSSHELHTRGIVLKWNDDDKVYTKERSLLSLYESIENMWSVSTYRGEDPEKKWNDHVSELKEKVIDWIIELRRKSNES
jgi:hypothetical protein